MNKLVKEEKCCGCCCWFKHEDTDGYGICYGSKYAIGYRIGNECFPRCNNTPCLDFVSNEQMRHHMAVLLQANRYRRDPHVPAIYRMPNPKELGEAIDFAIEYIKVFTNL